MTGINSQIASVEINSTEISKLDKPDAEITVKDSNLHDIISISNFEAKSNISSVQASLPDLSLTQLQTSTSQPLPNAVAVTFEVTLSNLGTAPAVNPILSLYMDNTLKSTVQITGTLNPGDQGVFTFGVTDRAGGSHTIKVAANESHTISESNYSNNTAEGTFVWKDCISLTAEQVRTNDGGTEYESNYQQKFIYVITNNGNLSAQNVPYYFYLNGSSVLQLSATIPARTTMTGSIFMTVKKAGNYQLSLKVDPNKTINDIDTSDNSAYVNLVISYDTELWAGKWADANDLDVFVSKSAGDLINNANAGDNPLYSAENAIWAWNGIDSDVSFGTVTFSTSEDIFAGTLNVIASNMGTDNTIAQTNVYKKVDNGFALINDVLNDNSNYYKSVVILNTSVFPTLAAKSQQKTITHEFGHALGLKHPECGDIALMRQTADSLVAFTIQPHDKYNLRARYS